MQLRGSPVVALRQQVVEEADQVQPLACHLQTTTEEFARRGVVSCCQQEGTPTHRSGLPPAFACCRSIACNNDSQSKPWLARPQPTDEVRKMGARLSACMCRAHVSTSSALRTRNGRLLQGGRQGAWPGGTGASEPCMSQHAGPARSSRLLCARCRNGSHSNPALRHGVQPPHRTPGFLSRPLRVCSVCFITCSGARSILVTTKNTGT